AQSLPNVRTAAITTGRESTMLILTEGEDIPPPQDRASRESPLSLVSEGFAPLVGMTLSRGRWMRDLEPEPVAVINETLARKRFPASDPIGARIRMPWRGLDGYATIVGVA